MKNITDVKCNLTRLESRDRISNPQVILDEIQINKDIIARLGFIDFKRLILEIEEGKSLSFEETYIGFLYVVGATNTGVRKLLFGEDVYSKEFLEKAGTIFLMHMRFQEERGLLTPEEIAGMVAATRLDYSDVISSPQEPLFENCGMGGDKGFGENNDLEDAYTDILLDIKKGFYDTLFGKEIEEYYEDIRELIDRDINVKNEYKTKNKKTVNVSTIGALILSGLGVNIMKHGSGKNTSIVGSSDYIKRVGIPLVFESMDQVAKELDDNNFVYTDSKVFKTIHDLSGSVIHTETVNHLVGPMTPPICRDTKLNKVIGINHNISSEIIAKSYQLLKEKGIYNVGDVIVVGGLSESVDSYYDGIHSKVAFDELSPFSSILSIVRDGEFIGNFIISPEDVGITIDLKNILVDGDENSIVRENNNVLSGEANIDLIHLVAYNSALSLVTSSGQIGNKDFIINGELNYDYFKDAMEKIRKTLSSKQIARHVAGFSDQTKQCIELS